MNVWLCIVINYSTAHTARFDLVEEEVVERTHSVG